MKVIVLTSLLALTFSISTHGAIFPKVVSQPARASATPHGDSFAPSFSPDGRFVVFVSRASNLATNGAPSPWLNVFLHDLETGHTELVSVNTNGVGGGNANSLHPSVSTNGLFVTFQSGASNLAGIDTNLWGDVYVRDMASGITTLASLTTNGFSDASGSSASPLISPNGSWILLETSASNFFPSDTNYFGTDIVLRDRVAGTNLLISVNSAGTASGIGRMPYNPGGSSGSTFLAFSSSGSMSDDARFIVFSSDATNLIAGTSTPDGGAFVRDLANAVTYCASTGFAYPPPIICADGSHIFAPERDASDNYHLNHFDVATHAITVLASNLLLDSPLSASADGRFVTVATTNSLSVFDTALGTREIICGDGVRLELKRWRSPSLSANGQRVAFAASTSLGGEWAAYVFDRQSISNRLVSVTTNGEPAEIGAMSEPVISRDGQRIAFESRAANIVAGDLNQASDIFVRDLASNTTHLVSASQSASITPALRSFASPRSLSTFARVLVFTSLDHILAENDDNVWCSAFVRDQLTGTNRVLATSASRALGTNRFAFGPVVSTNGRYAAWYEMAASANSSKATNIFWLDLETGAERSVICLPIGYSPKTTPTLSRDGHWLYFTAAAPGSAYTQVFRRDMFAASGTNELLSRSVSTGGPATGDSFAPDVTPDGKWTVFMTRSSDVFTNSAPPFSSPQLVARHESGAVRLISRTQNGLIISTPGVQAFAISGNSRYVFIEGPITTIPPGATVYRHDLKTGYPTNAIACSACTDFSVSDDGEVIAYRGSDQDPNIYARDLFTDEATLVSTNVTDCCLVGGSHRSFAPIISGDGRLVLFASAATNLVANDTNNAIDVFAHIRAVRATLLLSRGSRLGNGSASASSSTPVLAPDGLTILFSSSASDLVSNNDANNARDLFVWRNTPDEDFDGMDDPFEAVFFNTLDRDGSGDFDGDGGSDRQEFLAGTDPTDPASAFRVLTISASGANRQLVWSAQVNRRYRVQFKDDAEAYFWDDLGVVTATSVSASFSDPAAGPSRIYRVVLLP